MENVSDFEALKVVWDGWKYSVKNLRNGRIYLPSNNMVFVKTLLRICTTIYRLGIENSRSVIYFFKCMFMLIT